MAATSATVLTSERTRALYQLCHQAVDAGDGSLGSTISMLRYCATVDDGRDTERQS